MLFFNKTMLLPTRQRTPKRGLRTSRLMFWPGPDLNPIENIWSYIKRKLTGKHFSTTHQLFETINIEWNNIMTLLSEKAVHKFTHKAETFKEFKGKIYPILNNFVFNSCLFPDQLFVVKTIESIIFCHFICPGVYT